jgi:hypothetical protein
VRQRSGGPRQGENQPNADRICAKLLQVQWLKRDEAAFAQPPDKQGDGD